eukprot:TRINITY_DN1338_c0_g1_i1.p1 TRINITY_DN1338_c0_g1~~TRINITY_DN1338_c0_g1_i1.p1  ORF type:complete len:125 (-),score=30.12 TRINITY_DN1338_c0_g1_i1:384-758(-)
MSLPCFKPSVEQEADEEGYYFAALIGDIPLNDTLKIKINKKSIVLFKVKVEKTKVFAMSNSCVHEGAGLSGGTIEEVDGELCIVCPGHGIHYSLRTGQSVEQSGRYVQKTYKIKKKGKEVWVKK